MYNVLKASNVDVTNLLTMEILCHGVPSPKIWIDYLKKNADIEDIDSVDFRDKANFGWRDRVETLTIKGQNKSSKEFTNLFYSHLILRESCFNCNYKNTKRIADITIGDYWRIENNEKAFDDDKGVSFVLLNTDKGKCFFNECKDNLIFKEFPLATSIQPALMKNYKEPQNRKIFWEKYDGNNATELLTKLTGVPKLTTKQAIKKIVLFIPKRFLRILKVI